MDNKIYVAKLGKSVGLGGDLKIFIDSDFPEQFVPGAEFDSKFGLLVVERFNAQRQTIKFKNFSTIDDAKKLTNQLLYTTQDSTRANCSLDENQYFWFDIVGCDLYDGDRFLGSVSEIQRFAETDYLQVDVSPSLISHGLPKQFLVPYQDPYIKNVQIEEKKISTSDTFSLLENS